MGCLLPCVSWMRGERFPCVRAGRRGPSGHEAPFLEADEPLAADDDVVEQLNAQELAQPGPCSLVMAASSGLGVGIAGLGWLWLMMMLGTASMTAGRKTSAVRTMAEDTLPW